MRGLPFPSGAVFHREESHEYGTPTPVLARIDPTLGGPVYDPAIAGDEGAVYHNQVSIGSLR